MAAAAAGGGVWVGDDGALLDLGLIILIAENHDENKP